MDKNKQFKEIRLVFRFMIKILTKLFCIRVYDSEFYECSTYHLMFLDKLQIMSSFNKATNYKIDLKLFTKKSGPDFYINSKKMDIA